MTHMNSLKNCAVYTRSRAGVIIREVVRGGTTDTLALVLLLSDGQRLYNMASSLIDPEGKNYWPITIFS